MSSVPLVEELSPTLDPWAIARLFSDRPHLLFLDSSERHAERGRYSFVTADPIEWFEIAQVDPLAESGVSDPFASLQKHLEHYRTETIPGLPPFQGGLAGMFGYGLSQAIEKLPTPAVDEFQAPDLAAGIYDWVIAFDHLQERTWLIAHDANRFHEVRALVSRDAESSERSAPGTLRSEDSASRLTKNRLAPQYSLPHHPGVTSNFSQSTYLDAIARAVEYVHAGDCFQVNIAQRLLCPLTAPPLDVYGRLRACNPAPFAGYFDLGEFAIASASPERFLHVGNGQVETRPIKGTRPRGKTADEDLAIVTELAGAAKDHAENVMIVDLLRNDLGRVCQYGSVRVSQVCAVETYRFVHHLVSVVKGKLREGMTPFDLLRACFPGGSVTGAPKVRAMQIIAELEPTARGPYCGSLGYVGFDGAMDSNILIRTFTIGKGWMQFPVGGGIVADSDPRREYEETLHKAAGLLKAIRLE